MAIKSCFKHGKIENGTIIHFGRVCVSCLIHAIATRVYAKIAKKEYVSYAWKSSQVGPLQGLGCAFFLFVCSISEFRCHAVTRFPLKCFVSTRGWACQSYVTYSQDASMWFLSFVVILNQVSSTFCFHLLYCRLLFENLSPYMCLCSRMNAYVYCSSFFVFYSAFYSFGAFCLHYPYMICRRPYPDVVMSNGRGRTGELAKEEYQRSGE